MRTTMKLRTLVAAMLIASAPLAPLAATAVTASDIDKQTTQLNTTAENKGQTQVATKIASSFANLAGSDSNALKLVQALRNGTAATLTTVTGTSAGTGTTTGTGTATGTGGTTTTTITPPTGKMGWGNVFISLALAQDALARVGITNPTTEQLQAALNGGTVTGSDGTTVTLKGILQMRADGMGWGQIAQASGTKLGPVVSSIKSAHTKVASLPATSATGTTTSTTSATTRSTSKGLSTAAGTSATGKDHSSKGITTASGVAAGGNGSKGLVTAGGSAAGSLTHGNSGSAPGRGIVNAAGGGGGNVAAANGSGHGQGAGVVNAGGASAAAVTTAGGNAGGNGKGNAGGNGKGKGGG